MNPLQIIHISHREIQHIKSRELFLFSTATQLTHIAIPLASIETSDGDRGTVSQGASKEEQGREEGIKAGVRRLFCLE